MNLGRRGHSCYIHNTLRIECPLYLRVVRMPMHAPIRTYACGSRFASRIVYRALRAQYRVHVGGCLRRVLRIVRHTVLNVQFAVGACARRVLRISRDSTAIFPISGREVKRFNQTQAPKEIIAKPRNSAAMMKHPLASNDETTVAQSKNRDTGNGI